MHFHFCCIFEPLCHRFVFIVRNMAIMGTTFSHGERSGSGGRVLDSRPRGSGFQPQGRHCVVSMSKTH